MPCPTCGQEHGLCSICGRRHVHCPDDEPGEPFAFCDQCDAELAGLDHEEDDDDEPAGA